MKSIQQSQKENAITDNAESESCGIKKHFAKRDAGGVDSGQDKSSKSDNQENKDGYDEKGQALLKENIEHGRPVQV